MTSRRPSTGGRAKAYRSGASSRSASVSPQAPRPASIARGWTSTERFSAPSFARAERRPMSWRVQGSYFESCNCVAICPCRRIDGRPGGRSTWGECLGVLSWVIEAGHADEVSLDGAKVALATRYHDDEPGSPWTFVMYVDESAAEAAQVAL